MNKVETKKIRLTCPTCGIRELATTGQDQAFRYFAVQWTVDDACLVTITRAICRTCASAAIIQKSQGGQDTDRPSIRRPSINATRDQ